jgi:ABC-type transport system involved in multi-copper enzyme maturation permease subunit
MRSGAMTRILAVTANTFRETVRERALYNLVFFAILMTLSGLLLGQLSIHQDERIIKNVGLASMDIFGTVIAVFIGVGLVSKEIERRSLYPLLAKPLARAELLCGKFCGLAFTLLVNVGVMVVGLYATLAATGRHFDPHLMKAVYAIYLGLLLVVALALLFSTVTSPTLAVVFTVSTVIAGRFADVIRGMSDVTSAVPSWLITSLYSVVPNFQTFDLKDQVVYGDPLPWTLLAWITLYAGAYIGVLMGAAMVRFQTRDLA